MPLVLLGLFLSTSAFAEEGLSAPPTVPAPSEIEAMPSASESQSIRFVRDHLLHAELGSFGGASVMRLAGGARLEFFGGNADELFAESSEALELIRAMRTLRIVGTTMWAVGLTTLVAGLVVMIAWVASDSALSTVFPFNSFLGVAIVGGAIGMVGSVLLQSASANAFAAVSRYNAAILNHRLPANERIRPPASFSKRGTAPRGATVTLLQLGF